MPRFAMPDQVAEMFTKENESLVKKFLTQDIYDRLKGIKTETVGFTLDKAIRTCVENQDSGVGIYAGDEESYEKFSDIFDPIIEDYHGGYSKDKKHVSDMDPEKLRVPDLNMDDYIISTRIRVGRNLKGFGLSPGITRDQRKQVEELVTKALNNLDGELKGTYYPLTGMNEKDRQTLVDEHFLFKKGDRFLEAAGANRDWPEGRGIFHNDKKTFLVWLNEEDQLRIISMQKGGDFKEIFARLVKGIKLIEDAIKQTAKTEYMFNEHHGFIHSCPSNLGTGMRASVHVKLPKLGKSPDFKDVCLKLKLQPRGIHGEHSDDDSGIYDISNKHRIGYSEVELVQTMMDGVQELIKKEQSM